MLQLYNKNHQKVCILKDCKDARVEKELKTSDCKLFFSYPIHSKFYKDIVEESYIKTKENEYIVKEIHELDDWTEFVCTMNVENLEGKAWDRFESKEQTIKDALNLALVDTHWTVGTCNITKKRTVRKSNCNSWDIIQDIKKTYMVDITFDCINKIISIYEHLGSDKGVYFIDSLNLKKLETQRDSYTFYTRIVPIGKDGLNIKDINNGKDYVENYQYSSKIKTLMWKDERYTVKENLKADAQAKLNELSKPRRAYKVDIINLAKENKKYSILDYSLGDTITLISKYKNVREKQRIVKTTEYLLDHSLDSVEIANTILSFEDIQQDLQDSADAVNNITVDNGRVDGKCVEGLGTNNIDNFSEDVQSEVLKATKAEFDDLKTNKADIQDLQAVKAKIGTLEATEADITSLKSKYANIEHLVAEKATIDDLESNTARIKVLESKSIATDNLFAKYSTIENLNSFKTNIIDLMAQKATIVQAKILEADITNLKANKADISELNAIQGNFKSINADVAKFKSVFSDVLTSGHITANSGIIADGAIGDAQISSISANKISSGDIDTSKISIIGGKGRFRIVGDKLQVLDNKDGKLYERIMLGVDNNNNSALILRGSDGKTILLDQDGLSKEGFTNGYDKVKDNSLDASKFDFNTIIRGINKDGVETIEGTKVHIGDKTLDVELSTQKNKIDSNSKDLSTQSTQIKALDNEIKLKVDEQHLQQTKKELTDNLNNNLEQINTKFSKATAELNILKDSITSKVGKTELESIKKEVNGQIVETEQKIKSVESNIAQTADSIKEEIHSINADTIKNIDVIKQNTEEKFMKFERTLDSIDMSISSTSKIILQKADKKEVEFLKQQISELKVDNTGIHEHIGDTDAHVETIIDGIEQIKDDLVYKVEIWSSNGAVFQNGVIDTTLSAILYKGKEIVTDKFDDNQFRWTRISKDKEKDKEWNDKHFGGTKSIHITATDVYARATFNVEVFDKTMTTRLCTTY